MRLYPTPHSARGYERTPTHKHRLVGQYELIIVGPRWLDVAAFIPSFLPLFTPFHPTQNTYIVVVGRYRMGEYDTTIGVLLVGLFFNIFLYGLVCYQFLLYYMSPHKDRLYIRALVGALFVVDTIHAGVSVYSAWETCVTNFNNPAILFRVSWTITFTACATALTALLSQSFLGWRVFLFTKSKILAAIIFVFSFTSFICGMIAGVQCGILGEVALLPTISIVSLLWLVFQTSADIIITVSLCWSLWRSRTGFRKTDSLIFRVMRGAIQTGLFVTIFALGDMFSFHFNPTTNLYAMFAFPIGRIYTNTLLDTLLSRREMKSRMGSQQDVEHQSLQQTSIRLNHVDVNVSREVRVQRDFASHHTMDGSDRDVKGLQTTSDEGNGADQKAMAF
ncbi:uncharacterized protein STEHIDRAFT_170466 [Stereum hirsutum FP-91666 SS1]|uniref:uncharacterized protein n=1 Tax=Stereum hirsutum (strain FP-91666) TaxID=721885 RepID=UPI000444A7CF|nr:uncharacterized protein STEHIDRAFT_170466 [Stereum hirsutum FP-91666 SS1]EIM84074.1 hypothetical protein STEHIDRAFT_170466 [Stereum hirsutum FP-91666 SS1]